jgi:hypothetical protein
VNGQGIAAVGGTWHLVNAGAMSASSTEVTGATSGTPTTVSSGGHGH